MTSSPREMALQLAHLESDLAGHLVLCEHRDELFDKVQIANLKQHKEITGVIKNLSEKIGYVHKRVDRILLWLLGAAGISAAVGSTLGFVFKLMEKTNG